MTTQQVKRKLTAIFSADVKGYSNLMREDEEATVHTLTVYKEMMATFINLHRGRVVDSPGDNLLAEFASVVDAVQCAVEVQRELEARNNELPEGRKMEFRIGVNLGDVIEKGERIYGDGVNVAARLEGLAEAGGVCISRSVFDQIKIKLALGFEDLGEHTVKNITEPVRVYRVQVQPTADGTVFGEKTVRPRWLLRGALASVVVLLLGVAGVAVWNFYLRQSPPPVEVPGKEKMAFPLPDKSPIAAPVSAKLGDVPEQKPDPGEGETPFYQRPDHQRPQGGTTEHFIPYIESKDGRLILVQGPLGLVQRKDYAEHLIEMITNSPTLQKRLDFLKNPGKDRAVVLVGLPGGVPGTMVDGDSKVELFIVRAQPTGPGVETPELLDSPGKRRFISAVVATLDPTKPQGRDPVIGCRNHPYMGILPRWGNMMGVVKGRISH